MKILIYGYGNPGRQDDALGVLLSERIEKWIASENIMDVETDSNYQLNIEDSAKIADFDTVIFCDASLEEIHDYVFTKVCPNDSQIEFTTHAASPAYILDLCEKVFSKSPDTYLLHIKGYEWEFKEGLSENAQINLEKAESFLKEKILLSLK
ncbi:MAG TPA: hydrogenase maturation protease [Bacteroidales bacterium]|nr:hydrogenase maturation protease [Bacteroidales bacterium]HPS16874.1 hydrogenase maturation protease [Bacteroidales bacterium]